MRCKQGNEDFVDVGVLPKPATVQAASLLTDWRLFGFAGLVVGGITAALILYCIIHFRARPSDGDRLPVQFRENGRLELAWTIIPLMIVLGLFVHSYRVEAEVEQLDSHPAEHVKVDAFRWGWTFTYANGRSVTGNADHPPQLVLQDRVPTQIDVTSDDVTHSFWIPDFLFKRDAIPGQVTSFDLTPNRTGEFLGRCAQFCGLQHAEMSFRVLVLDAVAYRRWKNQVQENE